MNNKCKLSVFSKNLSQREEHIINVPKNDNVVFNKKECHKQTLYLMKYFKVKGNTSYNEIINVLELFLSSKGKKKDKLLNSLYKKYCNILKLLCHHKQCSIHLFYFLLLSL